MGIFRKISDWKAVPFQNIWRARNARFSSLAAKLRDRKSSTSKERKRKVNEYIKLRKEEDARKLSAPSSHSDLSNAQIRNTQPAEYRPRRQVRRDRPAKLFIARSAVQPVSHQNIRDSLDSLVERLNVAHNQQELKINDNTITLLKDTRQAAMTLRKSRAYSSDVPGFFRKLEDESSQLLTYSESRNGQNTNDDERIESIKEIIRSVSNSFTRIAAIENSITKARDEDVETDTVFTKTIGGEGQVNVELDKDRKQYVYYLPKVNLSEVSCFRPDQAVNSSVEDANG